MSIFRTLLLLLLFAFQSFATPWRPLGALKRALADSNQHERRGESSSAGYGQWSPEETGGAQFAGWGTTTAYKTIEKYKTSTVSQETCSSASPSTIFQTIVSTIQGSGQTVVSTVTQQVPTTILSTVVSTSAGSCSPVGPVIPPTASTITEEETTTITSTIPGPTIVKTQIVSAPGQTIVSTQVQYSTIAGPVVTSTAYTTIRGPGETQTVVSTQYQATTVTKYCKSPS